MFDHASRNEVLDIAFSNGYAFGRYTEQKLLSDRVRKLLEKDCHLLKDYMQSYNEGFNMGFADTHRVGFERTSAD